MDKNSLIYVCGHTGLVGSAILRCLITKGYKNIITKTHGELDLERQSEVEKFFNDKRPEYVFMAAAKVGGISANNTYPADFIYRNLAIQTNIIHSAYTSGVKRLIFLGSSCIYPRDCPQPIKEEYLLTGSLESTNQPYAVAKIAGIIQCEAYNRQYGTKFLCIMPNNLYGINDNFNLETSHVLPAMIRKFHLAKLLSKAEMILWGTGSPRREFLYVDDLADACLLLMNLSDDNFLAVLKNKKSNLPLINIGYGNDILISELAEIILKIVGYKGNIIWDNSKPDGTPRKLLDTSIMNSLGWEPKVSLTEGIKLTYQWYLNNIHD